MARLLTTSEISVERRPGTRTGHAALAVVAIAMAGSLAALSWVLPNALVLPALGLLLMACAGAAALWAFLTASDRNANGFSAWDAAGLLFLAGCCAAMLSEPARFLAILDDAQLAHQADPLPRDPPD
jgi:hypothetical protein